MAEIKEKPEQATNATRDGNEAPAWRQQLERHLADAKTLGNEIKGKLNLAGQKASAEAKETWNKLEPQLTNAEETLKAAADDAVESLEGLFGELKGKLGKLRDKL